LEGLNVRPALREGETARLSGQMSIGGEYEESVAFARLAVIRARLRRAARDNKKNSELDDASRLTHPVSAP
jgi:hypothetical protein